MKSTVFKILNFLLFFALTGGVVYLVFKDIPLESFFHKLESANYFYVVVSGLSGAVAYYFRGLRWKLMLKPFGYEPSDWNMFHAVAVGYFANMGLPRMGEVVRCASLKKTDNVEIKHSMGTVVTERISDLLVLFLLVVFVFIVKADFFGKFIYDKIWQPLAVKFSFSGNGWILLGIALGLVLSGLYLLYRLRRVGFVSKIISVFKGFYDGLVSVFKIRNKGLFLLYTLIIWLLYWLMAYIVFFAIDATNGLDAIDAVFILVAGSFGMVAPVQNGFGAYHWIVSQALMIYGISKEDGLLYATLVHEMQVLVILLIGPVSTYWVFFKKNKHDESKQIGISEK